MRGPAHHFDATGEDEIHVGPVDGSSPAKAVTAGADTYKYDLLWSPDSRRLLGRRDDLRGVRIYPLYSSTSNQPVDHSYFYAVPGDSAIPRYTSWIFDIARRTVAKYREAMGIGSSVQRRRQKALAG